MTEDRYFHCFFATSPTRNNIYLSLATTTLLKFSLFSKLGSLHILFSQRALIWLCINSRKEEGQVHPSFFSDVITARKVIYSIGVPSTSVLQKLISSIACDSKTFSLCYSLLTFRCIDICLSFDVHNSVIYQISTNFNYSFTKTQFNNNIFRSHEPYFYLSTNPYLHSFLYQHLWPFSSSRPASY